MKTKEEIRDLVAQKYKYKDWNHLHIKVGGTEMDSFTDEAMELYAEHRLLISSEAEKGESGLLRWVDCGKRQPTKEGYYYVSSSGFNPQYAWDARPAVHFWYADKNEWSSETKWWLEEIPSPPSPQEKQWVGFVESNAAQEFAEWLTDNNWQRHPQNPLWRKEGTKEGISMDTATTQQLFSLYLSAPAAPDKGEEKQ